jgi:primase-polymerase (primpol)-like protein
MIQPIYENIPQEMKDFPQWVNWKSISRKDGSKPTKPPYHPSGRLAESNNPHTWCSFLPVKAAANRFGGIGFVLTKNDPFVGLDFDNCRCPAFDSLDSEISGGLNMVLPHVADYVRQLNSYTEWSPSGKGIRIFLKGNIPVDGRRKGPIEVYQSGRYVTVTGHVIDGFPRTIESRQMEVDAFYKAVFEATEKPPERERTARSDISINRRVERAVGKSLQEQKRCRNPTTIFR